MANRKHSHIPLDTGASAAPSVHLWLKHWARVHDLHIVSSEICGRLGVPVGLLLLLWEGRGSHMYCIIPDYPIGMDGFYFLMHLK